MSKAMLLYAHHTDAELIDKVKMGHKACFEVLVRRHSQALYRIGRMFGLVGGQVEQLVSETHLSAFRNISKMRNRSLYRIWLTTAMMHKCRATVRTQTDNVLYVSDPSMLATRSACHYTERFNSSLMVTSRLEKQLDKLPVSSRIVFILHKIEGYSIRETAKLLNTSEQKIVAAIESAKASLRSLARNWHYHADVYTIDDYTRNSIVSEVMAKIDARLLAAPVLAPRA
ncbi:sigma-70 family RNA polymerase sigma factor [Polluticoccus soli]|uniref:sigma-70 family RNA polymerase sigma factor n=1 Tax=Polluticoccus soli TaxID=3034150 RepID=UPI0023E1F4B5|nr:sigma-70 family RNA polymerase sigma factor [Flavipsychrobacter sp. JY13-12]